jgi:hypothetical protein
MTLINALLAPQGLLESFVDSRYGDIGYRLIDPNPTNISDIYDDPKINNITVRIINTL